jgi:hypothetical protein
VYLPLIFLILPPAYGQANSEEGDGEPRAPNYDGRDVVLSFNVTHHIIEPGNGEVVHTTLRISVYDNKTGYPLKNVSMFITFFTIDSRQLLREVFFVEEGQLSFDLKE